MSVRTLALCAAVGLVASGLSAFGRGDADLLVRPHHLAALGATPEPARRLRRGGATPERGMVAALVDRHADANGIPRPFFHNLVRRESGYNPRAIGPVTRWGRAYGPTQILCSTARSLGESNCNRLLYDPDRAVGLAAIYIRQGYAATGSWRGAAAFYHGGPNRKLHGRKTAAYAAAVASSYSDTRLAWNVRPVAAQGQDFTLLLRGG